MSLEDGLSEKEVKIGLVDRLKQFWERGAEQREISREINIWDDRVELKNKRELKKNPYHLVRMGLLTFITPFEGNQHLAEISRLSEEMNREIFEEKAQLGAVSILLVPGAKFLPPSYNGFAYDYGQRCVVNMEGGNRWITVAHEFAHIWLAKRYGVCLSPMVVEGAAVFFARSRFRQGNLSSFDLHVGSLDVIDLSLTGQSVGISHTEMLEKRGVKLKDMETYNYSYRFGGYFVEYLVLTYGKEAFLRFYNKTCQFNLYNIATGDVLIKEGKVVKGVKERDIVIQALRAIGLDPHQVEIGFNRHIKKRTFEEVNHG